MITGITRIKFAVEVLIFVATSALLTYFSSKGAWGAFTSVAIVCAALFIATKAADLARFDNWFRMRIAKETELLSRCEKFGVMQVYNMQDPREKAERNYDTATIIAAGSRFCLSGSTGASYVDPAMHRHWDNVRAKLEEGCPFKLLLTDPFCPSKQIRNALNHVDTDIDPKLNLPTLLRLLRKYPHFEVKFTSEVYCSVFFSESEMMYDPYHLGQVNDRLENYFMALRLKNEEVSDETNYFSQLRRHFDYLWRSGTPLAEFVRRYERRLTGHLPAGLLTATPRAVPDQAE